MTTAKEQIESVINDNAEVKVIILKSEELSLVSKPTIHISVGIKQTKNLGNYESVSVNLQSGVNIELPKDQDVNQIISNISDRLKNQLDIKIDEYLGSYTTGQETNSKEEAKTKKNTEVKKDPENKANIITKKAKSKTKEEKPKTKRKTKTRKRKKSIPSAF